MRHIVIIWLVGVFAGWGFIGMLLVILSLSLRSRLRRAVALAAVAALLVALPGRMLYRLWDMRHTSGSPFYHAPLSIVTWEVTAYAVPFLGVVAALVTGVWCMVRGHSRPRGDVRAAEPDARVRFATWLTVSLAALATLFAIYEYRSIVRIGADVRVYGDDLAKTHRLLESHKRLEKIRRAIAGWPKTRGYWPDSLSDLVQQGLLSAEDLRNPRFRMAQVGYVYVKPRKAGSEYEFGEWISTVVLYENYIEWPPEGILVCFADCSIRMVATERDLRDLVEGRQGHPTGPP